MLWNQLLGGTNGLNTQQPLLAIPARRGLILCMWDFWAQCYCQVPLRAGWNVVFWHQGIYFNIMRTVIRRHKRNEYSAATVCCRPTVIFHWTQDFWPKWHCQFLLVGTRDLLFSSPLSPLSAMKPVIRRHKWSEHPAATVSYTCALRSYIVYVRLPSSVLLPSPFAGWLKCGFLTSGDIFQHYENSY